MFHWKQFVKGDDLHQKLDQSECHEPRNDHKSRLLGSEAKEIYESIVNEPSTSNSKEPESSSSSRSKLKSKLEQKKPIKPKPSVSTLFRFCESNNLQELSYFFENYSEELISNVNSIVDDYGWTLLMSAACAGSNSVVEYLLEIGADWKTKNRKGFNCIDLAKKNNKLNTVELISKWLELKEEARNQNSTAAGISEVPSEETEGNSNSSKKFCEACSTEIKSERIHNKCIAHLLSTTNGISDRVHYGLPDSNKGFILMLKTGWNRNHGLGSDGQGQKFPVKTVLKRDRKGFGETSSSTKNKLARITHFGPYDTNAVANLRIKGEKTINKEQQQSLERKARQKATEFRREFYSVD